jgi:hypothetical protein
MYQCSKYIRNYNQHNQLFIPIAELKSVQKGIIYSGIEIYITVCPAVFYMLRMRGNNLKMSKLK